MPDNMKSCLLDGEMVVDYKDECGSAVYLIYDGIILNDEVVAHMPFSARLKALRTHVCHEVYRCS